AQRLKCSGKCRRAVDAARGPIAGRNRASVDRRTTAVGDPAMVRPPKSPPQGNVTMRKIVLSAAVLAAMLSSLPHAAQAQSPPNSKSWVSHDGDDLAPNCGDRAHPCRTLFRALGRTLSGGEIGIADAADYGQLTQINRSISIVNDGGGAAGLLNPDG